MFSELASLLFMSRDFGHKAHLRTRSLSAHTALKTFYTELTDLVDELVEAYQGRNGIVDIPSCEAADPGSDPAAILREHLQVIEGVRYQAIVKEDAPLHNIIDSICVLYLSTLYKLENLK